MAPTVDSGWSWVVMIASAINNAVAFGVMKSGGVFYVALMKEINVNRSKAALCSSLSYNLSCFLAPISAYLCSRYSYKILVFSGGLLAAFGTILAALIPPSFVSVLIFYGIFSGLGLGFVILPNVSVVHEYFDKHRAFAIGFSMAGAAVGGFVVPPAFEYVLINHNFQAAILSISAFILHICPCGLLFRHGNKTDIRKQQELCQDGKIYFFETEKQQEKTLTFKKFLSVCFEKQFIFLLYSYNMFAIVWSSFFSFFQDYATTETIDDVTPLMAVSVLSAQSAGDLICRIVFGWISDRSWVNRQYVYTIFLAMSGILLICYTADLSYIGLMIVSICFGIFISGVIVLPSVLLYDHCGPTKFQAMFGIVCCLNGFIGLLAAPAMAYVRELSASYKTCFLIMGLCFISSSMLWITDEIYNKIRKYYKL